MAKSHQPTSNAAPEQAFDTLKRADNMALIFQEVLTVIVRVRASRQRFGDPEVFRSQIRNALKSAESEGIRRGYTVEDMRVGTFAVVAFLDESILNSQNQIFSDWQRRPLQQELFGVDVAGEIFFKNVDRLMGRSDSEALADLLEVHQLCLLLGFRGRYSASGTTAEIRSISAQIQEKIHRIRGEIKPTAWQPLTQTLAAPGDKWTPALMRAAIGCICIALLLFCYYKVSLASSAAELTSLAAEAGK